MSVDNRVVKLQFDNAQFEQGVSQSMKTLDELEDKLQFKKSAKGFQSLQQAADAIGFDKLVAGIDSINNKLSATGVLAANLVKKIGDSVMASVKKLEQATIGQMKAGGWARAMKIENAKFAVEGLKGDWEQLYKAIDYSVTGTAYGVDAAAKAASTFMASGVDYVKVIDKKNGEDLTQMHKALRAISGVAAQTNSEFEDISHIFTTVAGNGRVMGDQLQQLSGRGMNAAAVLGEQLNMSEAAVREAVSKGKIDFETFANAMDNAFGDHAKDANKTFTGSLSNMKAALSRFGAVFATPIITKTNTFFIAVTDQLKKMKNAISDSKNAAGELEEHLEGHFAKMWENLINLGSAMVENFDLTWFKDLADIVDNAVVKLSELFEVMTNYSKELGGTNGSVAKTLWNLATITKEEKDVAEMVIRGAFDNGTKRKKLLDEYIKKNELQMDPEKIQAYVNVVSKFGYSFDKAKIKVSELTDTEEEAAKEQKTMTDVFDNLKASSASTGAIFKNIIKIVKNYGGVFLAAFGGVTGILYDFTDILKTVKRAIAELTLFLIPSESTLRGFANVALVLADIFKDVKQAVINTITSLKDYVKNLIYTWEQNGTLERTLTNIARILKNLYRILRNLATTATRIFKAIGKAFFKVFKPDKATGLVADFTDHLASFSDSLVLSEEAADQLSEIFEGLFGVIDGVLSKIGELVNKFLDLFTGFKMGGEEMEVVTDQTEDVGVEVEKTSGKFDKIIGIGGKIKDFFNGFGDGFKELVEELKKNEGITHLKESLEKLGDAFKTGLTDKFDDLKDGLEQINEEAGTHFTMKDIAEGIGKVADKVADIVDKIPGAVDKVSKFFEKVWEVISGFFKKLSEDETWQGFKGFFDSLFSFGNDLIDGATEGFQNVGDSIMDGLNGIEWNDVLGGSFVLGALAFLVKMGNVCTAITDLFEGIGGIVEAITDIGGAIVETIGAFGSSMRKVTDSIVIGTIAASILAMVAAIFILSKIPDDDLSKALGTLEVIVTIFAIVVVAILNKMAKNNAALAARQSALNAANFKKEVALAAIQWIKTIGIIMTFAAAISAVASALKDIASFVKDFDSSTQTSAIMGIVILFAVWGGITALLTKLADWLIKKFSIGQGRIKKVATVMITFGGVMLMMAGAVWLVVQSIKDLAETGIDSDNLLTAAGAVFLIIFALSAGVSALMFTVKGIRLKDLGAVAIILLELIVALGIVFAGVYVLASLLTVDNALTKGNGFESAMNKAVLITIGVLLAITVAIVLITKALADLGKKMMASHTTSKVVSKVMLGLVGLITVVMICTVVMAGMIKGMNQNQTTTLMASMLMVVVMLIALSWVMEGLSKVLANFGSGGADLDKGVKFILSLGAMMIMLFAGVALVIAAASGLDATVDELAIAAGLIVLAMGGLILILYAMANIAKNTSVDAAKMEELSKSLLIASAAFLVMGLSMAILCLVAKDLSPEQLLGVVGLVSLATLAIVAISVIAKKFSSDADKITKVMKSLSLAMVAFAGMILLLGIAGLVLESVSWESLGKIGVIVVVLTLIFIGLSALANTGIGTGMEKFADVLQKIAIAFLIFGASVVVLAAGLWLLGPGATAAGNGLEVLFTVIEEHKGVAIALGGAILVVIIAITIAIVKLAPTLTAISTAITTAFTTVFNVIKTVGGKIWNLFKTGATTIGTAIKNFFTNSSISSGLKAAISGLVLALVSGLTDSGPEVLQKIGDFLWMIIDWLIKAIPKLAEKLIEILLSLIWGILDALTAHINEIEAAIQSIVETILAILGKLILDGIAGIMDLLGSALPDKVASFLGIGKEDSQRMRTMGDELVAAARQHAKDLKETARIRDEAIRDNRVDTSSLFSAEGEMDKLLGHQKVEYNNDAEAMKKQAELAEEAAFERKQAFLKFSEGIDMDKKFLYAAKDDNVRLEEIKGLLEQGRGFVDEAGNFYRIKAEDLSVLDVDPDVINTYDYTYFKNAEKNAENTGEAVAEAQETGLMSGLTNGVKKFTNNLGIGGSSFDVIKKVTGGTGISTKSIADAGYNIGSVGGENAGEGAIDALGIKIPKIEGIAADGGKSSGYEFTTEFGSSINDSIEDKDYEKAGEEISKKTSEGINNKESEKAIREAADKYADTVQWQMQLQKGKGAVAGRYIVDGIRIPLEQFASSNPLDPRSAAHIALNICDSFIGTLTGKSGFDEHSPSKKMIQIGQYLVQGLTSGINDEESGAITSMTDLSNMMLNSFTNPLDYVKNVANGTYTYDPSIRPVLDTSLVARGANGINSMFNHQNVTLNGLSGSIAADIGQLDGTNNEIIAELRALRSDMTSMGEQIAGMQVVMDSGRLVGAIAPDMDRALGNRATANFRGKG